MTEPSGAGWTAAAAVSRTAFNKDGDSWSGDKATPVKLTQILPNDFAVIIDSESTYAPFITRTGGHVCQRRDRSRYSAGTTASVSTAPA